MPIHSSRSRYEAFFRCPRYGFIQYHWDGRGIVRQAKNIFLTTGIWLHKGLEEIFKLLAKDKKTSLYEDQLDYIITQIKAGYFEEVFPELERKRGEIRTGFDLEEVGEVEDWQGEREIRQFTDEEMLAIQQQTFNEQAALIEALLRVFVVRILPEWMAQYSIVAVEKDMAFPLVSDGGIEIVQSATIDLVLQDRANKDIYIISFKSSANYPADKINKRTSHDVQGMSETWAFQEFLKSKKIDRFVAGVKMLHLIKGKRAETKKGSRVWEQNSPLIKGYKKYGVTGVEFAHSLYYPKPENKSGWGRLGVGWEAFNVFDTEGFKLVGGVKGWVAKLESGEIQPENGDILGEQILEPLPHDRNPRDIASWLVQTKARELDIARKLYSLDHYERKKLGFQRYLDENFPQNNQSCHGMHGGDCSYLPICWGTEEERTRPLENGYVYRTPHHKAELVQLEGMNK